MDVSNVMDIGDVIVKCFEPEVEYVVIDINPDDCFVYIMNRLLKRCSVIDFMDLHNWKIVDKGKFKIDISLDDSDNSRKEKDLDFYKTEIHRINYELDKIVNELHAISRKVGK